MTTIKVCDRCGKQQSQQIGVNSDIHAYAFDTYCPAYTSHASHGLMTVSDLCDTCADYIRSKMTAKVDAKSSTIDAGVQLPCVWKYSYKQINGGYAS